VGQILIYRRLAIVLLAAFMAGSAAAQDKKWQIDNNHSAAQFAVKHLGISTVRGRFNKMSGTVQYDPADATKTTIEATIEASSIDTRIEMRDRDLRSPNYFDVEKFPTLTFKSKRVEAAGREHVKVIGDLTIKGVTKEVVLDVDAPSPPLKDPRGNEHIGTAATTKLNRHDFGIGGNGPVVGDNVTITIDLELIRPASAQ
jgi:polyisoprenoid-binding protein YceI